MKSYAIPRIIRSQIHSPLDLSDNVLDLPHDHLPLDVPLDTPLDLPLDTPLDLPLDTPLDILDVPLLDLPVYTSIDTLEDRKSVV